MGYVEAAGIRIGQIPILIVIPPDGCFLGEDGRLHHHPVQIHVATVSDLALSFLLRVVEDALLGDAHIEHDSWGGQ